MPVADILQKPLYHRCGNHVSHALGHITAVTLERYADYFAVLHDWAATISRVYLRADLDRQMLIDRRVRVELEINPRNDPGGDRHPLASDWITVRRDGRFQPRNPAKLQWQHVLEKIRSRHSDHRQVAIIRNELYFGRIFIGIAVPLHSEVTAVGNNVCVRHDAIAAYDETGANAALEPSGVPRRFVIRLH